MEPGERETVYSESYPSGKLLELHSRFDRVERAVQWSHFKYIQATNGRRELYDLALDAQELRDLSGTSPELCRQMASVLQEWLEGMEIEPDRPVELDPDALERLRSLGYVR